MNTMMKIILGTCMAAMMMTACKPSAPGGMEQKEKEMLSASNPVTYYSDSVEYEDYAMSDRQPLIDWVLKDTATLSYPFTQTCAEGYAHIATSDDGKLRIYSWDTGEGGTMICWGNLIQYRSGKEVLSFHASLDKVLHPEETGEYLSFGGYVETITTIPTHDGEAIYLIQDYFRESSNLGATSVIALRIREGRLVEDSCFVTGDGPASQLGVEHTIADWYYTTNQGDGWDWLFRYDKDKQEIYIPKTDELQTLTDRYDVYRFDGERFAFVRTDGPYWLYPGLRAYERLLLMFETPHFRIRIDRLDDGRLRYASWSKEDPMDTKPALVLTGGKETDYTYDFENGSYRYVVHSYETRAELELYQDGERLLSEEQETDY